MAKAFGPYSPIRNSGGFYFISGQIGVNPVTKTVGKTLDEQTSHVFENLRTVLASEGLVLSDIVKVTIFLIDMGNFETVNNLYSKFFTSPYPARSTVSVQELPRVGGKYPIQIEIEAVAYKESV